MRMGEKLLVLGMAIIVVACIWWLIVLIRAEMACNLKGGVPFMTYCLDLKVIR